MNNPIQHDSMPHENAAGESLRIIEAALAAKFGRKIGVGLFVFDLGEGGYLGWASNCQRADTAATLVEWLGRQEPEILAQAVARWRRQRLVGPELEERA